MEARHQPTVADAVKALLKKQGRSTDPEELVPGVRTSDTTVDGASGPLPATVYLPSGTGPFPVILYFHGGGWVIADRKVYDAGARGLASTVGAVVVSVDYRQAPEHKFPAAWDGGLAAYRWLCDHAASIGGDTIINARLDPLRSDGAQLEDTLKEAHAEVERREYEGVAHEFFGATAVLEKARQALAFSGLRLREALT